MRITSQKLNPDIKKQIYWLLFQVIADLKDPQEVRLFLEEILSEVELEMLAKRLAIAHYLDRGRSYEEIKTSILTSSTTVASIATQVRNGQGLKIALKKIRAEQWADKWSQKISQLIGKKN